MLSVFLFPVSFIVWDAPLIWGPLKCPACVSVCVCVCVCVHHWCGGLRCAPCTSVCTHADMSYVSLCATEKDISMNFHVATGKEKIYIRPVWVCVLFPSLLSCPLWLCEEGSCVSLCCGPRLGQAHGKQPWRSLGAVSLLGWGVLINFR